MGFQWIQHLKQAVMGALPFQSSSNEVICLNIGQMFRSPELFLDEMLTPFQLETLVICQLNHRFEVERYDCLSFDELIAQLDRTMFNASQWEDVSYVTRTKDRRAFYFENSWTRENCLLMALTKEEQKLITRQGQSSKQRTFIEKAVHELLSREDWICEW